MTEAEWLAGRYFRRLYDYVAAAGASDRKLRLFGVACCRRAAAVLPVPQAIMAIEAAERFADGEATDAQRLEAQRCSRPGAEEAASGARGFTPWLLLQKRARVGAKLAAMCAARDIAESRRSGRGRARTQVARTAEDSTQADLFRCVFGNPFRPVAFSPVWRTDTAVSLARAMYDARDFSAMPILADALQDAGCDSADILAYCRGPGPHVRGCWVVDLVLGKE